MGIVRNASTSGATLILFLLLGAAQVILTASEQSRVTALISLSASLALSLPLLLQPSRGMALKVFVAGGTLLACYGLLIVDPATSKTGALTALRDHYGLPSLVGYEIEANTLALLTMPAVVASLGLSFSCERRQERLGWVVVLGIGTLVVLLAGSRTAILGASAGAFVVGTLLARTAKWKWSLVALGLACLAAVLVTRQDENLSDRFKIWQVAAGEMATAGPFGPGFGRFAEIQSGPTPLLEVIEPGRTYSRPLTAHNVGLQTMLDLGVPGAALLVFVVAGVLAHNLVVLKDDAARPIRAQATIALGCLVALLLSGLTESVLTTSIASGAGPVSLFVPPPVLVLALGATTLRTAL